MVTKKGKKQKAKYLWLTRRNAREIYNANRDTLDEPAYQESTVIETKQEYFVTIWIT